MHRRKIALASAVTFVAATSVTMTAHADIGSASNVRATVLPGARARLDAPGRSGARRAPLPYAPERPFS